MLDLARLEPSMVRSRWSVVLERTVRELQEIACTRSFGCPVTSLADLSEAVTEFTSKAAHKLR